MWIILLAVVLTLFYYRLRKTYSYWDQKGVLGPKPVYFLGNTGASLVGRKSIGEIFSEIYREYEGHAFVGIYRTTTPCLLIRDPELYKNIAVKDFASFHDNEISIDGKADPVFSRNPFVLKGDVWKEKRQQLTQNFTTGKIKKTYSIINEVSRKMLKYLEKKIEINPTINSRDLCVRYALDTMGTCIFSIDTKCFDEASSDFRKLADNLFNPGQWESFQYYLIHSIPQTKKILPLRFLSKELEEILFNVVRECMAHREKNNIIGQDFLEGIRQLQKSNNLQDIDIVGYVATIFLDGYETSSWVMNYLIFELALNQDAQAKLREELIEYYDKNGGEFTYDTIHEMPYLDACYNESLRKNTVLSYLSKECTKDYVYDQTNSEYKDGSVHIEKGTKVIVPLEAFHMDPNYFDEPDKYKPERFLEKENIRKYTFSPFGEGPRSCLGQRFARTQIKVAVANLIKNFELKYNNKTKLPLKYDPWLLLNVPIGALWMDVKKRET